MKIKTKKNNKIMKKSAKPVENFCSNRSLVNSNPCRGLQIQKWNGITF